MLLWFIKISVLFLLMYVYLIPLDFEHLYLKHVVTLLIVAHIAELLYYSGYLIDRYLYWFFSIPLILYSLALYLSKNNVTYEHLHIFMHEYIVLFIGVLSKYKFISTYLGATIACISIIYLFNELFTLYHSYIILYFFFFWITHTLVNIIKNDTIKNKIYDVLDICMSSIPAIVISTIIYNTHFLLYQRHYDV